MIQEIEDIISILNHSKIKFAVVLGSGLSSVISKFDLVSSFDLSLLPGYPNSFVEGHSNKLFLVKRHNYYFVIISGRMHLYEGYSIREILMPIDLLLKLNIKNLLLTNAAGGVNSFFLPGDIVLVDGYNSTNFKGDLKIALKYNQSYHSEFHAYILNICNSTGLCLKQGNYWFTFGPNYETPAEIRMIDKLGFDLVGMSSIPEMIYAKSKGVDTVVLSSVTNKASGFASNKLTHDEVLLNSKLSIENLTKLIFAIIDNF